MATVLSTKKLKLNQRSLLLNAGLSVVEYNAIHIDLLPFEIPESIVNAIFTSQNAVLSFQKSIPKNMNLKIHNCFCVGEKTKSLLEYYGHEVVMMTEYATELSAYLVENHSQDSFCFFCGNIRSDEIPTRLSENNINFKEIVVYETTLNPKKFERDFDAVLFYSPSGVRSFHEMNSYNNNPSIKQPIAVCIGTTTASEAKNYMTNVVVSNSTTVESVIAKTAKILIK